MGGVFGGWLLPRSAALPTTSAGLGTLHRLGVLALWCVVAGVMIRPFVPSPWADPGYAFELRLIQLTRGPEPLGSVGDLTPEELTSLTSAGLTGRLIESATFSGCAGAGCRRPDRGRLLVIMERPIERDVVLPEPTVGTRVTYVQDGTQWRTLPSGAPVSKRTLTLRPVDDARDQFMFQVQGEPWQTAYWLSAAPPGR
jgi:hypothetical protein